MQRKILIIDDHNNLAQALEQVFSQGAHQVTISEDRRSALAIDRLEDFDLVITDLDVENYGIESSSSGNGVAFMPTTTAHAGEHIKAFKISASRFRRDGFDEEELKNLVATVLDYKTRFVDTIDFVRDLHENIEFELPSAISLMHIVLEYLMKRVEKLGVVKAAQSNLFVALDEAFVNAVKHGNKFDANKIVRISAEVSKDEARFTIEDEGEGFDCQRHTRSARPTESFQNLGRRRSFHLQHYGRGQI